MRLSEFIRANYNRQFPINAWVEEYGFEGIYVRIGRRYLNDEWVKCLDIANIKARITGQGCFTHLIELIQLEFPNLWIYVENVQTSRFANGLIRLGFVLEKEGEISPPSFYLEPLSANIPTVMNIRNL